MLDHPPDPLAALRSQALAGEEAAVQVLADALCDAGPIGLRFVESDTASAPRRRRSADVESAERVIAALESRDRWRIRKEDGRLYVFFAPDCFHNASVSGGENDHLWVPDARADFEIVGDVCPITEGDVPGQRWRPMHEQLGRGLLPI